MITREHEDRAETYTAGPGFTLEVDTSAAVEPPYEWRAPDTADAAGERGRDDALAD
ncbi:hypothetical protein [Phytomonospora endophytica]|uniref:Uncharacterized protein n=1 Tax=Phytomonospora endophytica TaxID=714109 RepID=A0A841FHS8_9ACTN|nr:hypothetical protein [Phytomonospora endophytica]MBB6035424.1 hypothetical protein [Phytomonospora endophytica]GIG63824.1 hypothetical protein Pen01_01190 [Phytomonospora endophytica]